MYGRNRAGLLRGTRREEFQFSGEFFSTDGAWRRHKSSRNFRWEKVQVGNLPVGPVTHKKEIWLFYLLWAGPRTIVCLPRAGNLRGV
jgi:hypothetical protein